jgi:4'-phosphopantetheinyl transferase
MVPVAPIKSPRLIWPATAPPVSLVDGEVHVWAWTYTSASSPQEEDLRILDDHERQRVARFHFVPDRIRYSLCHASMRRILASYLDRSPESLIFRERPGGKPDLVLSSSDPQIRFNLSHSKSVALLAIALDIEVGADVEDIRPIEPGVAARYFSAAELASLAPLRSQEWLDAFYRCWTRKEAILKAEGLGLRIPLESFDVTLRADEPAELLGARPEAKLTAQWQLHHLSPADGVMAALAVGDSAAQVVAHSLPSSSRTEP